MRHPFHFKTFVGIIALPILLGCSHNSMQISEKILLHDNWYLQHSDSIRGLTGTTLSNTAVNTAKWYKATVPSTIMGVLISNGLYKNIFSADSIYNVDTLQFERSWWYRTTFDLTEIGEGQHIRLCFDGISYYANIWLNGTKVAAAQEANGTFRRFEFDITHIVKDAGNMLAVEVFRQRKGDPGLGFVDWNPAPPDKNMGLWREAFLKVTGDVAMKNLYVQTEVNTRTLDEAHINISADITNYADRKVKGTFIGKAEGIEFEIPVSLNAGETRHITVTPDENESLHVKNPRLWWCNNMGDPNLYHMNFQFKTGNYISDDQQVTFGIRKVESYLTEKGYRGFRLNGKDVLIKGAGWTDDIFLRNEGEYNEIQARYVKDMNLNTIRFENIWGNSQQIYDLCDRYGLLAMVGWSCQWEWENYLGKPTDEYGGIKSKKDMDLVVAYLEDQIRYLQNHPSVFVWMLGSDMLPRPALEKRYRDLISSIDGRPYLAAASKRTSKVSGPTGVKMNGPYNYVGPSYWYLDTVNGGAFGFNTETGPGPQLPVKESILKFIPENKLWPPNPVWNTHCNPSDAFGDLGIFNSVLYRRYGNAANIDEYLMKAGAQSYEAMKGMFEAFRANRPNTTGIIQWMLNSAWPSFYWQLYDYYLVPVPAYYAVKKANRPLQIIYNYGNNHVVCVNETSIPVVKARIRMKAYDIQGRVVFSEEVESDIQGIQSKDVFKLPGFSGLVFLSLGIYDVNDKLLTDNFYWLPAGKDVYDWENTEWYYTPVKTSADMKSLAYLPPAEVSVSLKKVKSENEQAVEVSLKNTSGKVAFYLHLNVINDKQQTVVPVFWDDNYVSLSPGEEKNIRCHIPASSVSSGHFSLSVSGWNVKEQIIDPGF